MGSRVDAYDAVADGVVVTLETEPAHRSCFKSRDEARLAASLCIEGYCSPHCRHSTPGYRSPVECEKMLREGEALLASAVQRNAVNETGATPERPIHRGRVE